MRGRRFLVTWCEEDTAEALKAAYQGEREVEFRTRLHGLWLLRSGWRLLSVAAVVGAHYRTVQRWVGWYREGGVGNVLSHKMGGKGQEPFLTDEAQEPVKPKSRWQQRSAQDGFERWERSGSGSPSSMG